MKEGSSKGQVSPVQELSLDARELLADLDVVEDAIFLFEDLFSLDQIDHANLEPLIELIKIRSHDVFSNVKSHIKMNDILVNSLKFRNDRN